MCTAFVHHGNDIIFGFNMDLSEGALDYGIYATDEWFCIGTPADLRTVPCQLPAFYRVSDGIRKIHGVSRHGVFTACLNNMNFRKAPFRISDDACSIDQLMDDLITGCRSVEDVRQFAEQTEIVTIPGGRVNIPNPGFHSLSGDVSGRILLLEPGNGYTVIQERYAVMTNFPLLELPPDLTGQTAGYYGKDRYNTALGMLRSAGNAFSVEDAFRILRATQQTGYWATRVSFVYSRNENTVFYCCEGAFDQIRQHRFS